MATIFLFLLLSAIFTAEAQSGQSRIEPGSFLTATLTTTTNSLWLSPSGLYAFGFHKQGNGYAVGIFVEGIPQKTVVWTAKRDNPPVPADATLNFTSDGQLVLRSEQQGTETIIIDSPGGATSASMLDSGNFLLNNSNNNTIWQSFEHPTDTLLPSQHLSVKSELYSSVSDSNHSTGKFRLLMQQDGYLAMYPVGTPDTTEYGYWNNDTPGQENDAKLNLDDDGHLYLDSINGNGTAGMVDIHRGDNSTKGLLYLLRIDADGILRLYSHTRDQNGNWSVTWSKPDDKCAPKGLCGLNADCVQAVQGFDCKCPPRFAPTNQSEKSSGCERKKSKKGVIIISVSLVAFAIVLVISGVVMYRYRV